MSGPPLHPNLEPLAGLVGTWAGGGRGEYPTIDAFDYVEAVTFGHVGKPFLAYAQRTTAADDGRPLHAETGYLRAPEPGRLELVIAHPTGHLEVARGDLLGTTLAFRSSTITATPSAKPVNEVVRTFHLEGDELRYQLAMAAVGLPLTHHLAATLRRQPT